MPISATTAYPLHSFATSTVEDLEDIYHNNEFFFSAPIFADVDTGHRSMKPAHHGPWGALASSAAARQAGICIESQSCCLWYLWSTEDWRPPEVVRSVWILVIAIAWIKSLVLQHVDRLQEASLEICIPLSTDSRCCIVWDACSLWSQQKQWMLMNGDGLLPCHTLQHRLLYMEHICCAWKKQQLDNLTIYIYISWRLCGELL